jgi:hypothetical protein
MKETNPASFEGFSLVKGGPTYRLMCRLGLIRGDSYVRMALLFVLLTWVVLFFLCFWQGVLSGDSVRISFLQDFAVHARFLVGLPLLIVAETLIDKRVRKVARHFIQSNLVETDDLPRFQSAVAGTQKWRDAILPEAAILLLVIVHGWLAVGKHGWVATNISSWYAEPGPEGGRLTPAGWWLQVSIPVLFFFTYRWLWRLLLWARLLWRVSQLNLQLIPTHPDRAGGLAFLSAVQVGFGVVMFAISASAAGLCANMISFQGETLVSLRELIVTYLVILTGLFMTPMLPLVPKLYELKKKGLLEYGALAAKYTQSFDTKWARENAPVGEPLLGNADLQSLADLGNSFEMVRKMRIIPIDSKTALRLLASAAGPFSPLLLTMFPLEELLRQAVRLLF